MGATIFSIKDHFWDRYKIDLPADTIPADALISRRSREIAQRHLRVYDVSLLKTLTHLAPPHLRPGSVQGVTFDLDPFLGVHHGDLADCERLLTARPASA